MKQYNDLLLRTIMTHSSDEIFITDGEGNVIDISPACYELYGFTPNEMVGKNVFQLEKEGVLNPSITALVLRTRKSETKVQVTSNGKKIAVSGHPLFDNGELVRTISFSTDITEIEELKKQNDTVTTTLQYYKKEMEEMSELRSLYSRSGRMERVLDMVEKVADLEVNVLIEGESGVGKNRIARLLHEKSSRKDEPFIELNCGAIPESLFESELFGYEEGAFTGAKKGGKQGSFERAGSGTLLLDEIGELPLHLQTKLLSVLQDKRVTRVGGESSFIMGCRIIFATNKDLKKLVEQQQFREDLYYRIDVVNLEIPPLRERRNEIQSLITDFVEEFNKKHNLRITFSEDLIMWLSNREWPGNVRELRNYIERTMVTAEHEELTVQSVANGKQQAPDAAFNLNTYMEEVESAIINRTYEKHPNSIALAKALGISQPTANRKIRKYVSHK
ncbi:sigma-54 interaction domain-containing protein [Bacillus piscicola]|uniref:sigma-54 interaction domain-containing protein n=1 Tax=Bacillus piscicola TaxID=1632684 RepID=UPI001F095404|nr:sigma 54-interacting transcriptional regulator [Bacillus piscicola]